MAMKKQAGKASQKAGTNAETKPLKKTAPAEETKTVKTAVQTAAEQPVTPPAEERAAENAAAKVEQTESKKTPVFVPDSKDKKPRGYASRIQLAARYTEEQAQNMLRKKIYQYKEVHLRFLRKVEEASAFSIERLYVPVHCGKTEVRYQWKTKTNKVESQHEEICAKEKRFSGANKDLEVENFQMDGQPEVMEKKKAELVEGEAYNFKKAVHAFNAYVKTTAPAKHATVEKRGEEYVLVYVPVIKATCTLDSEKYVGYVNMHNGACYSSYKVSDVLEDATDKAVVAAKLAKRTLVGTFLFSMTFCLLTLLSALSLVNWKFGALQTKALWISLALAAFSLPSLVLAIMVGAIKKENLIAKSVRSHKMPSGAWPRFASIVGVLCMVGTVLLFFFQVMI